MQVGAGLLVRVGAGLLVRVGAGLLIGAGNRLFSLEHFLRRLDVGDDVLVEHGLGLTLARLAVVLLSFGLSEDCFRRGARSAVVHIALVCGLDLCGGLLKCRFVQKHQCQDFGRLNVEPDLVTAGSAQFRKDARLHVVYCAKLLALHEETRVRVGTHRLHPKASFGDGLDLHDAAHVILARELGVVAGFEDPVGPTAKLHAVPLECPD